MILSSKFQIPLPIAFFPPPSIFLPFRCTLSVFLISTCLFHSFPLHFFYPLHSSFSILSFDSFVLIFFPLASLISLSLSLFLLTLFFSYFILRFISFLFVDVDIFLSYFLLFPFLSIRCMKRKEMKRAFVSFFPLVSLIFLSFSLSFFFF